MSASRGTGATQTARHPIHTRPVAHRPPIREIGEIDRSHNCKLYHRPVVIGSATMGLSFTEREMIRRPGDRTPEPPGGRAAERLRMFEQARSPSDVSQKRKSKKSGGARKKRGSRNPGVVR